MVLRIIISTFKMDSTTMCVWAYARIHKDVDTDAVEIGSSWLQILACAP